MVSEAFRADDNVLAADTVFNWVIFRNLGKTDVWCHRFKCVYIIGINAVSGKVTDY